MEAKEGESFLKSGVRTMFKWLWLSSIVSDYKLKGNRNGEECIEEKFTEYFREGVRNGPLRNTARS